MKKVGWLVGLFLFLWAFPGMGHAAAGGTHIYLDGKELNLSKNGQVQEVKGSIMIPIRVVMEELGFQVSWEKTGTIHIKDSNTTIQLNVNSKIAKVNGKQVSILAAPYLKGDTSMVPLRFISEQMGIQVSWVQKTQSVYLVTPDGNKPGGNDGNGLSSITGISFSDNRLLISVHGKVTPNVFKMTGPNRIVVDIPNTNFGSTFPSGMLDSHQSGQISVTGYPDLSKVRYSLYNDAPSTVRIVLDLNYAKNYGVTNAGDGLLIIDLNKEDTSTPTKPPGSSGKKLVVLDAGHGGSDPGAISVTSRKEKDFNLAVVLKVEQLLKNNSGIDLVLTRSSDTYPSLKDRVKIAENLKADIFISVHANSGSAVASGVETYYSRDSSIPLAKIMHKYLVKSSGLTDRKVRYSSLHVTRETTMPAVLLECGYLSNKNDAALLYTNDFQNRVAEGIVMGIKEYLGVK
ncbi:N-acetylmuramoyl-L-alanine amidase [Paenibacillus shirakamiensis]|uniref:N-acetylmuramoyl-L-alanine amidase n=1 Tax=Paenibacillus shirakamiensis TaxID=1265935 RepID=A0ABS4JD07_9BACL|nr:N-acetylmuramoyl-L-alanine amidase family protein [Paenibacillus shirakamiensis]MBP1999607.1 N-acetylmuramoyl-L-alanine amidase [Paenibacillus shirakamiensis]